MKQKGSLSVTLVGGCLDGDTVLLLPDGSVGPPSMFGYLGSNGQAAGFHIWTCGLDVLGEWPEPVGPVTKRNFYYSRFVALTELAEPAR